MDKKRNKLSNPNSLNRHICFGVGQNQADYNKDYKRVHVSSRKVLKGSDTDPKGSENCPTIRVNSYLALPEKSKRFIHDVAGIGKRMARKYYGKKAFSDGARNKYFSHCLNKDIRW